jgi:hypothetical protein
MGKRIQKTQHIIASVARVQNKSHPTDTKKKKKRNHKPSKIGTNKFRYLLQNSFSQNQFFSIFFFQNQQKDFTTEHPTFSGRKPGQMLEPMALTRTYRTRIDML